MKKKLSYLEKIKKNPQILQTGKYTSRLSDQANSGFHESFRTSDKFFQQLVDSLEEYAVFTTDTKGKISSWNTGAARILGYSEKEIIGKCSSILFIPEDKKKGEHKKELAEAIKHKSAMDERWHVRKDKSRFWGSGRVFPLYDSENKLRGFTKIMRDLTDRKTSEEVEKRFQSIIENSTDGVRMIDKTGKILYASPSTARILGYSKKEYLKLNILDLIHPDDKKNYKKSMEFVLKHPAQTTTLTYRIKHKNGEYRWMEGVGVNLLHDPVVQAIVSNFRDITPRKQVEEEKEKILNEYKTVLDQLPAGVIISDAKTGKFTLVNKQVNRILKSKNITAESYSDYKKYKRFYPDGTEYEPEEWPMARATRKGERIRNVEINIRREDGTYGYILVSAAPIKDKNKKIISGVSAFLDITDKKDLETRKDEFVSLVSHELKTPITSLNLFAELLRKEIKKGSYERTDDVIRKIKHQTSKLSQIVNDLLDVSRIETGKMKFRKNKFDIYELIKDISDDLQFTNPKHKIVFSSRGSQVITADKYRVYQVLTNLLTNAVKYSPSESTIYIEIQKKKDYVQISVKDKGIGISKSHQEKIFEKLYQVSDPNEKSFPGLGMGLYISREIVLRHGGEMWVESKKGKGSKFVFTLPISSSKK